MTRRALAGWLLLWCLPWIGGGMAVAADAEIAVVASARAPDRMLPAEALARIFRRKMLYWPDGIKIEPVNLPATDPLRQAFSRHVLKMELAELEDYWNQQYFHGIFPPYVLASQEAVLRFVADNPGAIGYVAGCAVDARVVVVLRIKVDELPGAGQGCAR